MVINLNLNNLNNRPRYPAKTSRHHLYIWLPVIYIFLLFLFSNQCLASDASPGDKKLLTASGKEDIPDNNNHEKKSLSEIGMKKADSLHATLSRSLNVSADWIDSFFRKERAEIEEEHSSLRLKLSELVDKNQGGSFNAGVRMHLVLPNLENRLHLFVSSFFDEDQTDINYFGPREDENYRSRNMYLSMRYFFRAAEKNNLSLRGGLRFHGFTPAVFTGPRYSYSKKLSSWNLRFIEDVTYFTDIGWESRTSIDFEKPFSESLFYRTNLSGRWNQNKSGYLYWINTDLYQTIDANKAYDYWVAGLFETSPYNRLKEAVAGVRYRQNFLRKWLFFEIAPQIAFRQEEDYKYSPGITISLEVFFGEDFMDYVPLPL